MLRNKELIAAALENQDRDALRGLIVHYSEWIVESGEDVDSLVGWIYMLVDQLNLKQVKVVVGQMLDEKERDGLAGDVDKWRKIWRLSKGQLARLLEMREGATQ